MCYHPQLDRLTRRVAIAAHMRDELLEVLARLLDLGGQDDGLLEPVRGLHEIVRLELEGHLAMGVLEPEVLGLVPLRRLATVGHEVLITAKRPTPRRQSSHDKLHLSA